MAEFCTAAYTLRGNLIDLAIGVIIGGAFGKIIDSLVKDIIMPLISVITGGGVDFTQKFFVLGSNPDNLQSLDALQKAGVTLAIGTDGCASNNDLDMVEEMRLASFIAKVAAQNPTVLPARQALDAAHAPDTAQLA